jgi:cysteine-rich repeat protein
MIDAQRPSRAGRERHVKLKNSICFATMLAASWGCDDAVGGGGPSATSPTTDAASPVVRGDAAAAQRDAAPPTVDCDEAPNGTPCGTPGSGKHCVLEACVENTCGDGIIVEEDNEECDDGNEDDGDGCSERCDEEQPDAGRDAGADGGSDAGTDAAAAPDASSGVEAGMNAGGDAAVSMDAALDSAVSSDASGDATARTDAAADTGSDTGTPGSDAALEAGHEAGTDAAGHEHDASVTEDAGHEQDAATVDTGVPMPTCAACAEANCRAFQGADLVAGCFTAVSTDFGASAGDPTFIQECTDTVACARQHSCGFTAARQAQDCYCGTNDGDTCTARGPAADAPCLTQWQHATRSTTNAQVLERFSDLAYPAGWAYYLTVP